VAEPHEPTWGISELHDALNEVIEVSFGSSVWVAGELRSLSRSHAGHAYFDLVDPDGADGEAARLSVTLFNGYRRRVNAVLRKARADITMAEGTVLRIQGELRTYPARSRVQLVMTGIDPTYTIGVLTQQKERVLAALGAEQLLDRNAALPLALPTCWRRSDRAGSASRCRCSMPARRAPGPRRPS
jgi:exonuclease VII large subunit